MKISEAYPSSYIRAVDLQGRAITATVDQCKMEDLDGAHKPVLYFTGKAKGLVLNKTNANTLGQLLGDETADWRGKDVELYPARVSYQGKEVDAIRIRSPRRVDAVAPAADEFEADIPF